VWVGDRWVLTCAHVLGPEPRAVMVRFSFAGGEPVPAAPQGWLAEQQGDLALLELDLGPPPTARPAPLRPARAVTGHACAAYGYPAGHDGGVFSEPEITGQTVDRLSLVEPQQEQAIARMQIAIKVDSRPPRAMGARLSSRLRWWRRLEEV
jgi:hypothetical protein